MRSTSGYASILCIVFHQLQPRDSMAPITRGLPNGLIDCMVLSVYLSSLPVAHLSDDPRRRLVNTGNSARIQDETTESSAWFDV